MKKILMMLAAAAILGGCAANDKRYDTAKTTYLNGKEVIKYVPKDEATSATLGVVDWFANTYDTAREWVRGGDSNVSD